MRRHIKSKKELELLIQDVPNYRKPKVDLEQYVTDANIVAELVWISYMKGELQNARVLDLGCGTGRFSIAVATLSALQTLCLDVDIDAILQVKDYTQRNWKLQLVIDLLVADARLPPLRDKSFDIVFQNPPFGIQEKRKKRKREGEGIDVKFLKTAARLGRIIYTIHKASTRDYILKKLFDIKCSGRVIGTRIINIPPMYRHHFKRLHKVEVVLLRAEC